MQRKYGLGAMLLVGLIAVAGCGGPSGPDDLDQLTEDGNGNGFLDVTPPDGIEFSSVDNINVRLNNTIGREGLALVAAGYGIDANLLGLATILATMDIDFDYGNGITDALSQAEPIEPFDKKFEVACPEAMEVHIYVTASAPIVGTQTLFEQTFSLVRGDDYECGQTVGFETSVDANGNPTVTPL
jgi:hypothetical protein